MVNLIIGILIGIVISLKYAAIEHDYRIKQQQINKSIRQDLNFYKKLSKKYEQELEERSTNEME